jgi:hypothetical protein
MSELPFMSSLFRLADKINQHQQAWSLTEIVSVHSKPGHIWSWEFQRLGSFPGYQDKSFLGKGNLRDLVLICQVRIWWCWAQSLGTKWPLLPPHNDCRERSLNVTYYTVHDDSSWLTQRHIFIFIPVVKVVKYSLASMKPCSVVGGTCLIVGRWKNMLASLTFEVPCAADVKRVPLQLAPSVVCMSVESANH